MVSRFVALLVCVLLAPAVVAAQTAGREAGPTTALKNPVAATARSIQAGKAAFQRNCRFCHGPEAKGDGPQAPEGSHPPNLTDSTWLYGGTDGDIFQTIQNGLGSDSVMKGYKSRLTPEETWNIINFLRSLGADSKVP